jgi:hypothetical protein
MGVAERRAVLKTTYRGCFTLFHIPRSVTPLLVGSMQ